MGSDSSFAILKPTVKRDQTASIFTVVIFLFSSENDVFDGYNKTKRGVYYDD